MKIPRVFVSPPTRQDPDEIDIGALRNANVRFWGPKLTCPASTAMSAAGE